MEHNIMKSDVVPTFCNLQPTQTSTILQLNVTDNHISDSPEEMADV